MRLGEDEEAVLVWRWHVHYREIMTRREHEKEWSASYAACTAMSVEALTL